MGTAAPAWDADWGRARGRAGAARSPATWGWGRRKHREKEEPAEHAQGMRKAAGSCEQGSGRWWRGRTLRGRRRQRGRPGRLPAVGSVEALGWVGGG